MKYSARVNHYTRFVSPPDDAWEHFLTRLRSINLTKLDVLDKLTEIKVATKYRLPSGELTEIFPTSAELLEKVEPIYDTLAGWNKSTAACTSWEQLPAEAKSYVEYIEKALGIKIDSIGCGPGRENMIFR